LVIVTEVGLIEMFHNETYVVAEGAVEAVLDLVLCSGIGDDVPAYEFLDDAPTSSDLVVDLVEFFQFPIFPVLFVDGGVEEVDPLLAALDLVALESILVKSL
jgi:hypothetical protein